MTDGESGSGVKRNRLTELLEAYRNRPASESDRSLWSFVSEKDPHMFSHHPATREFREHVWKIGGLYFCKGCVATFCGIISGILFFAASRWLYWFTDLQVAAIFVLLLVPTLVIQLFELPRWSRSISRFLLGFLMASAFFMLFVTESWWVRAAIVAAYVCVKIPMTRKRNREHG